MNSGEPRGLAGALLPHRRDLIDELPDLPGQPDIAQRGALALPPCSHNPAPDDSEAL